MPSLAKDAIDDFTRRARGRPCSVLLTMLLDAGPLDVTLRRLC